MRSKKRLILIAFMVIIIFSLCINYTYSQLSPTKRKELVIAYMNGYYRALQLDIKEIKELQNDKNNLKREVKAAGREYANLIDIMNPPKSSDDKGYRDSDRDREYKEREASDQGNQKY